MANKRKEKYDKFYDQAWQIVQQMKQEEKDHDFQFNLYDACSPLFTLLKSFPDKESNVNFDDLQNFFMSISIFTNKGIADIKPNDVKKSIDLRILGEPIHYSFYFNIGTTGVFLKVTKSGMENFIHFQK